MKPSDNAKPWETLGISRRTYYRQKSAKVVPSATVVPQESVTDDLRDVSPLTRKQYEDWAKDHKTTFTPNWYSNGYSSRGEVLKMFALK